MKRILMFSIIFILVISACNNKEQEPFSMDELNISPDFKFNTTKLVELNLNSTDSANNSVSNIPFSLFKKNPETSPGSKILSSITDKKGNFQSTIKLASYYNKIYILPQGGESQVLTVNHISNNDAEVNSSFTFIPGNNYLRKNSNRFTPVTASDSGFDFNLVNIVSDCVNTATMTISITNNNNKKFNDAYFTIPSSVLATEIEPNNTNYESPAGMNYWVQYPVDHWIMGNSIAFYGNNGFQNGETDYYYITLPLAVFEFWDSMEMYASATGNTSGHVTLDFSYIPECSITEYYPSESGFGTLAFEDYWPTKGDYDMNDLVIDYNISCEKSFEGNLNNLTAQFKIRAIGASYNIGFGVEFPDFIEVTGAVTSSNGLAYTETNNRTVIIFDDARDVITENPDHFINTDPALAHVETEIITVSIPVTSTDNNSSEDWYLPPYNPFIFVNNRTKEIHLADYPPTEIADISLFNTEDDASAPALGFYYRTSENLPWAFHIAETSAYPIEKVEIIQAFPDFFEWAESEGQQATDWYSNPDINFIYPEP